MKIKVKNKQSLQDIAMEYFGNSEKAFEIALQNSLNPDATLSQGQELDLNGISKENFKKIEYLKNNEIIPATFQTFTKKNQYGIGKMKIGVKTQDKFIIK